MALLQPIRANDTLRTGRLKAGKPMAVIDTHAHWYPGEWLRLFERDGPAEGASLERTARAT
jgi:hypothetical protein